MTAVIRSGQQWLRRTVRRVRQDPFAVPETTRRIQGALRLFWLDVLLVSTSVSLVGSHLVLYALGFGATSSQIGLMSTIIGIASIRSPTLSGS